MSDEQWPEVLFAQTFQAGHRWFGGGARGWLKMRRRWHSRPYDGLLSVWRPAVSRSGNARRVAVGFLVFGGIIGARSGNCRMIDTEPLPRVYVVDDDESMRSLLCMVLHQAGYATTSFANPAEFLREVEASAFGCAVVDLRLPEMSGLELQEPLESLDAALSFILISGHLEVPATVAAMRHGAVDVLEKPFLRDQFLAAVASAVERAKEIRARGEEDRRVLERIALLTARERQVFEFIISGESSKRIAKELGISRKTIEVHRSRIRAKLEYESMTELVDVVGVWRRRIGRG